MITGIGEFISTCPFISGNKINVNYLGEKAASYTIESVPSSPVIKRYTDGGELRQQLFIFASRELYTESKNNNTGVVKFYEDFAAWIEESDRSGRLPVLPPPYTAEGIEVLSSGYCIEAETKFARYQIQCRLIYYK